LLLIKPSKSTFGIYYRLPKFVPLALFSRDTEVSQERDVECLIKAPKIIIPKKRFGTTYGKPKFSSLPEPVKQASLTDFISGDSWFFFTAFGLLEDELLAIDVSE